MKKALTAVLVASLLVVFAPAAAAEDGCPDGWEPRTVPGVSGTFCYSPILGYTLGSADAHGQGHIIWPDNDDDHTNTPPRPPRVPRIPSDSVFEDWAEFNDPDNTYSQDPDLIPDQYVQVPGGYVRRKLHEDGTTRCYFNSNDGSLYDYGEC